MQIRVSSTFLHVGLSVSCALEVKECFIGCAFVVLVQFAQASCYVKALGYQAASSHQAFWTARLGCHVLRERL